MAVNVKNFAQLVPNKCSELMNLALRNMKPFNRKRNIILGFVLLIPFRVCNYK